MSTSNPYSNPGASDHTKYFGATEPAGNAQPHRQPHVQDNIVVMQNKSTIIAYVLWFFLGQLGVHRFYLGAAMTGLIQLGLAIGGWVLSVIGIGFFLLIPLGIWLLIDILWIPIRTGVLRNRELQKIASKVSQ